MPTLTRSQWSLDQYGNSVRLVGTFDDKQRVTIKSAHDEMRDYLRDKELVKLAGMTRRTASSVCG